MEGNSANGSVVLSSLLLKSGGAVRKAFEVACVEKQNQVSGGHRVRIIIEWPRFCGSGI